jgi:hypothetical protein
VGTGGCRAVAQDSFNLFIILYQSLNYDTKTALFNKHSKPRHNALQLVYNKTYLYVSLYVTQLTHNISVGHTHTAGATAAVIPWQHKVSLYRTTNQDPTVHKRLSADKVGLKDVFKSNNTDRFVKDGFFILRLW